MVKLFSIFFKFCVQWHHVGPWWDIYSTEIVKCYKSELSFPIQVTLSTDDTVLPGRPARMSRSQEHKATGPERGSPADRCLKPEMVNWFPQGQEYPIKNQLHSRCQTEPMGPIQARSVLLGPRSLAFSFLLSSLSLNVNSFWAGTVADYRPLYSP